MTGPDPTPSSRRLSWLLGLLLVLVAATLFASVLDFGFLYLRDDDINVAMNPHMGSLGRERLAWMFSDWAYSRRYMPLGWLNFSATYAFAGLDPRPYHAVSLILIFAEIGLLLAVILRALRVFGGIPRSSGLDSWEVFAAFLASAWWALNPLRVETTAWISGNLYGQATALILLSVLVYLGTYEAQGTRRGVLIGLSALAYGASLLTYPIGLGIPVLLVGMDWVRSRQVPGARFSRLMAEKAAFFLPLVLVLAVTLVARFQGEGTFGAVPRMGDASLLSRAAQSSYIAAYYLWKPWWPLGLSPLYDVLVDFDPLGPAFLISIAAVGGATVLAILTFRRWPAPAALWLGYLACAAPFFGLTERPHMPSDRYSCLLSALCAAVLAYLLSRLRGRTARPLAAAASLAVITALGALSVRQLRIWTDDRAQHAYVAAHLTNAALLDDFTGRLLILEFMRGDEKQAEEEAKRRLDRNPSSPGMQRALALFAEKRRVSAYYGPASTLAIAQEQMALSFARSGQFREANDHFEDALRLNDHFYQAAYDRALVLLKLGRPDDALRSYLLAVRWASPELAPAERRAFLRQLLDAADSLGRPGLSHAARAALGR